MNKVLKVPPPPPGEYRVGCPYCGRIQGIQLTGRLKQVACPRTSCRIEWHEGVFKAILGKVLDRSRKDLGKREGVWWKAKILDLNGEESVDLKTHSDLQIRRGDIVTFSYGKTAKGILRKHWTGDWSSTPNVLVNHTLNHGWKI